MKGLFTAMITPFDPNGKLDEGGLRSNLRFQIKHKVDGVVLLGTTGEVPTLSSREKKRIIEIGAEETKGNIKLIIGTGSYSTERTIEDTKLAKALGADGALVVTPYYNKPTQEGLFRHYKALSEAVDFPILTYNIAGRTGLNILTETLQRIYQLPNIVGVKESSGNIFQIDEVIQSFASTQAFSVLSGDDNMTFSLMSLGGHGVISVASNLIPQAMRNLVYACLAGDFKTARLQHQMLTPLFKSLFIETNPIPIKAAMQLCGMASGPCRLPLCELLPENQSKLATAVKNFPIV